MTGFKLKTWCGNLFAKGLWEWCGQRGQQCEALRTPRERHDSLFKSTFRPAVVVRVRHEYLRTFGDESEGLTDGNGNYTTSDAVV